MKPFLFHLPLIGWTVKGYGLMLMIGFLAAVWLATRRAARAHANPDIVLNVGFVALICGVIGARLWYYIHYYNAYYSRQPFWALFDVTSGGLTFFGGFLLGLAGILAYLLLKRVSLRLYLDILAPSVMLGLAFGRIGCFLNGCCYGDICADRNGKARLPWAVTFPYNSPVFQHQWRSLQITVPKELVVIYDIGLASLIRREHIYSPPSSDDLKDPRKRRKFADIARQAQLFGKTPTQLSHLAASHRTLPVQPAQLYGSINALLISLILAVVFTRRRRHGIVVVWLFVLYGISRFILEQIRTDNPHDVWIFTISQAVSLALILAGFIWLAILYRLPAASPRALPFSPPARQT